MLDLWSFFLLFDWSSKDGAFLSLFSSESYAMLFLFVFFPFKACVYTGPSFFSWVYLFRAHASVFSSVPRVKSGQCRRQQLKLLTCTYGKDRYNPGKWMSWIAFRWSGCFSQASTMLSLFGPIVAGCVILIIRAPLRSYTPVLVWEPFLSQKRRLNSSPLLVVHRSNPQRQTEMKLDGSYLWDEREPKSIWQTNIYHPG